MLTLLDNFDLHSFQQQLLSWYEENHRDLPWRKSRDPYLIWVSETMLQQTRVDTVIPYFERFIEQFPTLDALAEADEEQVLKAWEGLGYYSRAKNLQTAVREVKEKYGGRVPHDEDEIASLKGVGPYTAGAILSIAYNKPVPAVDGNVMRVLSRIFFIEEDIAKSKTKKTVEKLARKLIPRNQPSDFNQALMELGAMICTPRSPACLLCPVQEQCRALEEGVQNELPLKAKKKAPKPVNMAVAVITNGKGSFLIHRRPNKGLLAGLWEFPTCETLHGVEYEQLQNFVREKYDPSAVIDDEMIMEFSHVFSHIKWNLSVYRGRLNKSKIEHRNALFVSAQHLKDYPFSVSHKKIIERVTLLWNLD